MSLTVDGAIEPATSVNRRRSLSEASCRNRLISLPRTVSTPGTGAWRFKSEGTKCATSERCRRPVDGHSVLDWQHEAMRVPQIDGPRSATLVSNRPARSVIKILRQQSRGPWSGIEASRWTPLSSYDVPSPSQDPGRSSCCAGVRPPARSGVPARARGWLQTTHVPIRSP